MPIKKLPKYGIQKAAELGVDIYGDPLVGGALCGFVPQYVYDNLEVCKACPDKMYLGENYIQKKKYWTARVKCKACRACGKWTSLKGDGCPNNHHSKGDDNANQKD